MPRKKAEEKEIATGASKQEALSTMIEQLDKNYGKGTVMRLGEKTDMGVEAIPTGSLGLDIALGIGGVPREGSSRSTARKCRERQHYPSI